MPWRGTRYQSADRRRPGARQRRAQGIGNAFYEHLSASGEGQLLNASLADYLPTALDVPRMERHPHGPPSPHVDGHQGRGRAGDSGRPAVLEPSKTRCNCPNAAASNCWRFRSAPAASGNCPAPRSCVRASQAPRSAMLICGDVGGTKALIALAEVQGGAVHLRLRRRYRSADYPDLTSILQEFVGVASDAAMYPSHHRRLPGGGRSPITGAVPMPTCRGKSMPANWHPKSAPARSAWSMILSPRRPASMPSRPRPWLNCSAANPRTAACALP